MWQAAAIQAGGSLAGSALGIASANRQMKWQERMSNTAYRRAKTDMELAGLNPMMMYGKGAGGQASTPTGAAMNAGNPLEGVAGTIMQGKANQIAQQQLNNATRIADAEIRYKDAQTTYTNEQAETVRVNRTAIALGMDLTTAQIITEGARALTEKWRAASEEAAAKTAGFEAVFYDHATKLLVKAIDYLKDDKKPKPTSLIDIATPEPVKDALRSFADWLFGNKENRDKLIEMLKAIGKKQESERNTANEPGWIPSP